MCTHAKPIIIYKHTHTHIQYLMPINCFVATQIKSQIVNVRERERMCVCVRVF